MIYKNPYYVNKDPLKTILFDGDNGSGKPMIYRNPFVRHYPKKVDNKMSLWNMMEIKSRKKNLCRSGILRSISIRKLAKNFFYA